jgi:hypothetical protein
MNEAIEVLTSLGTKTKIENVRRASKPQTAESKAFRRHPGEFSAALQGRVHMEAVGSELRIDTHGHMGPHTHPEEGIYWIYTLVVLVSFSPRFVLCLTRFFLLWGVGCLGPKTATSVGVVTGLHLTPCIPKT